MLLGCNISTLVHAARTENSGQLITNASVMTTMQPTSWIAGCERKRERLGGGVRLIFKKKTLLMSLAHI